MRCQGHWNGDRHRVSVTDAIRIRERNRGRTSAKQSFQLKVCTSAVISWDWSRRSWELNEELTLTVGAGNYVRNSHSQRERGIMWEAHTHSGSGELCEELTLTLWAGNYVRSSHSQRERGIMWGAHTHSGSRELCEELILTEEAQCDSGLDEVYPIISCVVMLCCVLCHLATFLGKITVAELMDICQKKKAHFSSQQDRDFTGFQTVDEMIDCMGVDMIKVSFPNWSVCQ